MLTGTELSPRRNMAHRSTGYYLMKTSRLTGWLLLFFVLLYLLTGYAMCDRYEVKQFISLENAQILHRTFDLPLLFLFVVHVSVNAYFALRRRKWIKPRTRT